MSAQPDSLAPASPFGLSLPDYPWDAMAPYKAIAARHGDGPVDLSLGTPVDSTPDVVREALIRSANAPGYPGAHGTASLREAIAQWFTRRRGIDNLDPQSIMPTVGSKELIAWLPFMLGLGPMDVVVRPKIAYPTYDIGAKLCGATSVACDSLEELDPATLRRVRMVWINSPGNPTGQVRDAQSMKTLVSQAREIGAVVASDECYAELGWDSWDMGTGGERIPCVLESEVSGGSTKGLLSLYSLSKQSNLAGYRAAFVAGDEKIMASLVNTRKHAGMIVPSPIMAAMEAALNDEEHVRIQKAAYRRRREILLPALQSIGFNVEHSEAGLYLWATAGQDTWHTVQFLAEQGIIVGPGSFYGRAGEGYVRFSITGSDERIAAAAERLTAAELPRKAPS
ncbi:succinyldiaminopimelate transaminase [Arthrobacter pascens]|uniref:succinyldiaminopimelate transaminase n=1 Tax=Arthrobacter pascens TaxID=1677 RepID=UPI00196B9DED|nr:succinyldiaminopimelate transaminase [Arthrobacter pascens]MBN3497908.1 succinyldiaminopimelate transaminase [Arthrobacter pascens]